MTRAFPSLLSWYKHKIKSTLDTGRITGISVYVLEKTETSEKKKTHRYLCHISVSTYIYVLNHQSAQSAIMKRTSTLIPVILPLITVVFCSLAYRKVSRKEDERRERSKGGREPTLFMQIASPSSSASDCAARARLRRRQSGREPLGEGRGRTLHCRGPPCVVAVELLMH